MVKEVIFMSRDEAEAATPLADWAVISIHDYYQDPAELKEGWQAVLQIGFYDEDLAIPGLETFSSEQADSVIAFIERVAPTVNGILVHCNYGISRSAAMAKYIALSYGLSFPADYNRFNKRVYRKLLERSTPTLE